MDSRNNRNILECKFINRFCQVNFIIEIIETYWNVNDCKHLSNVKWSFEIIETYWNVNQGFGDIFPRSVSEIIETYWNVN